MTAPRAAGRRADLVDPRYQRLLHDALAVSAARTPDKPAAIVGGQRYSYATLLDAAARLSAAFTAGGVGRGDRVVIYLENTWPGLVSIYGALMAGGAFVMVNPQTKADKLQYILNDSGAAALVADAHLARQFVPALAGSGSVRLVVSSGPTEQHVSGRRIAPFDEVLAASRPAPPNPDVIALDLAALIYTSGSTGAPKGVAMSHQSMTFSSGSLIELLRLSDEDRIVSVLPMAFNYGLYQLLLAVRAGGTLVLERSFTFPADVFRRMRSEAVTVFPGVPTIFTTLAGIHARSPLCFPSVRRMTNTAAALSPKLSPALREIFPNALVFKMYGLTECKRVCSLAPELADVKPDSVGKPVPGVEAFLLTEDGRPVGPGETGILHVRGPNVMMGYWNQPQLTAEMIRPGRYPGERILCTHDLFRQDADGDLYFVGRSDDIIKTRGEKVSPVEVESCLHRIEGVREAAVVGVPHELYGEAVKAFVALEPSVALTEKDIKTACAARLENYMVPSEVVFLPELPKTQTGKVRKKSLVSAANDA